MGGGRLAGGSSVREEMTGRGRHDVWMHQLTPIAEYIQLCRAIAVGFVVMGFIGYFVKLIHIPM
jgi:hypothetical protein